MAKSKTVFVCQSCGVQSPKWIGKCNSCGEWNSYVEELVAGKSSGPAAGRSGENGSSKKLPVALHDISIEHEIRLDTCNAELNRVLGGGIVLGSLILLGGEPGIGKSTLVLQMALSLNNHKVLYVSGEESAKQIKIRAERIGHQNPKLYILSETRLENIFMQLEKLNPDLLIVDSIQTVATEKIESSQGSVSQIRECTAEILTYAKQYNIPVLLIGHINKEGHIAGPKVLEHIVDTVLQFEGDPNYNYRILRATKNRFGATSELGIFEMQGSGLTEVNNPSELLLTAYDESLSGVAIASGIEGMRPFLIEIQALVSSAAYGTPQRSATGYDLRRLNMMLAVLEKRAGFRLGAKDVFLNIAGGIKVNDPAIDLAVVAAILSSDQDLAIPQHTCFAGEVGLSGEIRPVQRVEQRISEAEKLGFREIFISKYCKIPDHLLRQSTIKLHRVGKVEEVFAELFG